MIGSLRWNEKLVMSLREPDEALHQNKHMDIMQNKHMDI